MPVRRHAGDPACHAQEVACEVPAVLQHGLSLWSRFHAPLGCFLLTLLTSVSIG